MADSKVDKWRRWCEEPIRDDILTLHLYRHTFREVARITKEHGELPDSFFWMFVADTYARTQAIAIRRQTERKRGVRALGQLLWEIERGAGRLTRSSFLKLSEEDQLGADRDFTLNFGGAVAEHVDPEVPKADLARLVIASASVKRYVDRRIAHSDAGVSPALPTFREIDSAIDLIGELFSKYAYVLTGARWLTLEPVIQHDWLAIFRESWIRGEQETRARA